MSRASLAHAVIMRPSANFELAQEAEEPLATMAAFRYLHKKSDDEFNMSLIFTMSRQRLSAQRTVNLC